MTPIHRIAATVIIVMTVAALVATPGGDADVSNGPGTQR
jgi:hypothetical protein